MRRPVLLTAFIVLLGLGGVLAAGARADGSPFAPGLVQGASGVLGPGGVVRYVALSTGRSTVVAAIRVRSGRVARSNVLRGFYGVPIVAWDGATGGVSADGRTLLLASYGPYPGTEGTTSFVVVSTRTLRKVAGFRLQGSWAYDAVSPDGATVYLIEYLAAGPSPHYRVRSLDTATGKLSPDVIADRREGEALMRGQPVTRKPSADGRWAYTLYARRGQEPFVHALDTVEGKAYCIDLPLRMKQLEQMALRFGPARGGTLVIRSGRSPVAVVDTRTFDVRKV